MTLDASNPKEISWFFQRKKKFKNFVHEFIYFHFPRVRENGSKLGENFRGKFYPIN